MPSWRDAILDQFVPRISKLSLVSDPDNLLTEEHTAIALRNKGFDILEFSNAIEFRYSYEMLYRSVWDRGEKTELVVILHTPKADLNPVPFDLLETGKQFYFSIAELFPLFSPPILEQLDKSILDALYAVKQLYPKERLSDDSTMDFIFRTVYKIDSNSINDEIELLKALSYIHFGSSDIPEIMLHHLTKQLLEKNVFKNLAIYDLLFSKDAYSEFVIAKHKSFMEQSPEMRLAQYVKKNQSGIAQYLELLPTEIPGIDVNYKEWIAYAYRFASLASSIYLYNTEYIPQLLELSAQTNHTYMDWLQNHIAGLIVNPSASPVMVHHIPHYLARQYNANKRRIALIVMDGLALDQWITLKETLPDSNVRFVEQGVFSWVPTLTAVSRQAIFSGKRPYEYATYINTTSHEEHYWHIFWETNGFNSNEILFLKGINDNLARIKAIASDQKKEICGFVINKIDDILHGMALGMQGMHNQIKVYAETGFLSEFIAILNDNNFDVYLTADHGNIDCVGSGRPRESSIAMSRGERAQVYKYRELLDTIKNEFPETIAWKPINLPNNYYPLLSYGKNAFVPKGQQLISHGSISMQESIVPFVKIERK